MTIEFQASAPLPTRFGDFVADVFRDDHGLEHLVLRAGTPVAGDLVRLHSECATGDIFGSLRCDCRNQLEASLNKIRERGQGLVIYLRGHEGRGIGLANKIRSYELQDQGCDTVEANLALGFPEDPRSYGAAIGILKFYGLDHVVLLTNNRRKIDALTEAGIRVDRHVSLWTDVNPNNAKYLATKRDKLHHLPEPSKT